MTIESKGYVATTEDITALAKSLYAATATLLNGRTTYLRALVGTTIKELGGKPRTVPARGRKPATSPETTGLQLQALETVHMRFYEAVEQVAMLGLPNTKDRALELNRKTNFARTAMSSIRAWIKAGNDITTLPVAQVTKRSLLVERAIRPKSATRLRRALEVRSKSFVAALLELAETDKAAALGELELLMGQMAAQAVALGATAVTSPARASKEHRPYKTGGRVFVPVSETQVIRQQERPS